MEPLTWCRHPTQRNQTILSFNLTQPTRTGHYSLTHGPCIKRCVLAYQSSRNTQQTGFHASGDGYTHRFGDKTVDMTRKNRCIDYSLLWDDSVESSFWHTMEYIAHCGKNGIVCNPDKFHLVENEFAGFLIMADSIKPTKKMPEAILHFPTPTNIMGIRSWFGFVIQVSYAFSQVEVMALIRELLHSKNGKFYCDKTLDQCLRNQRK